MSDKEKCVVCFSGGLDSTVLLYDMKRMGYEVYALSVYYGQRHARELDCANRIAKNLGVKHHVVDFGASLIPIVAGSSQTSSSIPVPEGHYTEESMKATVVPNRNMLLLALATAWAVSLKAKYVMYAAHAGDHTIYPDCRPEFIASMKSAVALCDWHSLSLYTPYCMDSKSTIVKLGAELGVPFKDTYTCYNGRSKHCGKCGSDVERKEAFRIAQVPDPTEYEDETGVYRG